MWGKQEIEGLRIQIWSLTIGKVHHFDKTVRILKAINQWVRIVNSLEINLDQVIKSRIRKVKT